MDATQVASGDNNNAFRAADDKWHADKVTTAVLRRAEKPQAGGSRW
ncbi:hypothetical protein [Streptomyces cyaneofuscatus]